MKSSNQSHKKIDWLVELSRWLIYITKEMIERIVHIFLSYQLCDIVWFSIEFKKERMFFRE